VLINKPAPGETPIVIRALLQALERARTSLAIAIAVETKLTPPAQWQYYLDTADVMGKCIRKLRRDLRNGMKDEVKLFQVLEELHNLSEPKEKRQSKEVLQLCRRLRDIMAAISLTDD
jgi:hypothetical protein